VPRYRNVKTGEEVDVSADPPKPGRGVPSAKQHGIILVKLEQSKRWQRVDSEGKGPKPSDVRAWAKAEGIDAPARGKLPDELVEQYLAAQ
jgi:hypothetical protein